MKLFSLLVFLSLALPFGATAQNVPQTIPVQGILTDSDGVGINSPIDITFTFYDASGAVLHSEGVEIPVENGFFSVSLGEGGDLPISIFQYPETGARQLGIRVGSDEEMSPRLTFGSVPYAVTSQWANTALTATTATESVLAFEASTALNAQDVDDGIITQQKLANARQLYRVTALFCEAEPGTLMTTATCHANQRNVDSCANACPSLQRRVRNCQGECACDGLGFCVIGQPCPPPRGPSCPNTPAGYIVGP